MRDFVGEQPTIAYFAEQYSKMLDENFDDYADNFARHMKGAE